jgi:hypothetical protein
MSKRWSPIVGPQIRKPARIRRLGAAILASLAGLVVGAVGAALLGAVLTMLRPGIEYASRAAFLRAPLLLFAEGLFWALIGGAMFMLPVAILALTVLRPPNTPAAAIGLTALLALPMIIANYPNRALESVLTALPIWVAARVGLFLFSRLVANRRPPD